MDSTKFNLVGGSNDIRHASLSIESEKRKSADNISIKQRHSTDAVVQQHPADRWMPNAARGRMPRIGLPGLKEWYETKDMLKQAYVQTSWRLFAEGRTRTDASKELHSRLKDAVDSKAMGVLMRKAVGRYIDKKANNPHFVHFPDAKSTLFVSKGTDLSAEIARTAKGDIYKIPHEVDNALRASILDQQGRRYTGNGNLGSGKQGDIKIAVKLGDDEDIAVAAKWLKTEVGQKLESRFIHLLPHTKHFTEVRDMAVVPPQKGTVPEPHVFMDLAIRGDMHTILHKLGQDTTLDTARRDKLQRTIARQLVECVKDLHDHGIYHQDIKPGNFLLSKDGAIMLTDFGVASKWDPVIRARTRGYDAPEFGQSHSRKSEGDRYSLGMTLFDLRMTFPGSSAQQKQIGAIVNGLMATSPADRPSLDTVLESDYMQGEVYSDAELVALIDSL